MWFIITSLIGAFFVGLIARALVSGPGPKGCIPTTILGLVGSFIGGFLGYLLFNVNLDAGAFQPAGLFGSVVGAVIALLIYRSQVRR
jgi:uncharacterized membrane protein YeaQ/YmgE (transglycosylase-associated protein family)